MKNSSILTYQGTNEELFVKLSTDGLDPDARVIVPETHNAILLKDGQMMDTLNSGSHNIFDPKSKKTQGIFVEVIFMSKTAKLKVNWGTKTQFSFRDTETDVPIKVGAHGEFEVQICNPRKSYLELIGAEKQFSLDKLKERLAMRMMSKVEPAIARAMREKSLTYDRMSEHKDEIAQSVLPELSKMFEEDYGLKMFSFTLASVLIADEYIRAIEEAKREQKAKAAEEAAKRREEEVAAAQDEKNLEREKFLRELEKNDYEKYLEVCKVIGWEPRGGAKAASGRFCPNCGHSYEAGDKFCPGCGKQVGNTVKICPSCKKENSATANFCSGCGAKL